MGTVKNYKKGRVGYDNMYPLKTSSFMYVIMQTSLYLPTGFVSYDLFHSYGKPN